MAAACAEKKIRNEDSISGFEDLDCQYVSSTPNPGEEPAALVRWEVPHRVVRGPPPAHAPPGLRDAREDPPAQPRVHAALRGEGVNPLHV